MTQVIANFRFAIGDEVCHLSSLGSLGNNVPTKLIVLELLAQTCPGGTQLKYVVFGGSGDAGAVMEIELAPWSDAIADHSRIAATRKTFSSGWGDLKKAMDYISGPPNATPGS